MVRLMRAEARAQAKVIDAAALAAGYDALACDVCIIGSGPTAQAIARNLDPALAVIVLEAGSSGQRTAELQHALGASIPLRGSHAPEPSSQVSLRLGGSLDLPAVRVHPEDQPGSGIRLAQLHPNDFVHRQVGSEGWPLTFEDLSPYYKAAQSDFGIEDTQPIDVETAAVENSAPFWCVPKSHIAAPTLDRFGGATVVVNAPVWRLELDQTRNVRGAVVRHPINGSFTVNADQFILAAGTYSSTRILLESGRSDGSTFANSSGLLGCGLMDHPQLRLGVLRPSAQCDWDELRRLAPHQVHEALAEWPKLVTCPSDRTTGLAATILPTSSKPAMDEPRRVRGGLRGAQELADGLRARKPSARLAASATRAAIGSPELIRLWSAQRARTADAWSFENGWWADEPTVAGFDVLGLAEQLPRHENRVTLGSASNRFGWGQLRVQWTWSEEDRILADRAADPIVAALEDQFGPIERTPRSHHVMKFSSHHGSGTARMSSDPERGVVDAHCRSHDHPNLFVVGAAVFPSIGFANPTLTSVALGFRLAEYFSTVT